MAVTISNISHNVVGNRRHVLFDVTGPSSYTTGGEALTAAQLNSLMPHYAGQLAATDTDKVLFFESDHNSSDQYLVLDKVNDKMMFFSNAGQVAGSTNISTVTISGRLTYKA